MSLLLDPPVAPLSHSASYEAARSLLKNPTAPLPKYYCTDSDDLTRFLSQFEDTISKFRYPAYDKVLLLKQQMSGRALILVDSLAVNDQTYVEAIKLLQAVLDCPITKTFNVIKPLSDLSML